MSNYDELTAPTYALVNPVAAVGGPNPQNVQHVPNANLPSGITDGPGTGQFFFEAYIHDHTVDGSVRYPFSLGIGSGANNIIALRTEGGGTIWGLRIDSTTSTAETLSDGAPIQDAAQRLAWYVDLTAKTFRVYLNGRLHNSGTVSNTHNIASFTEDLTVFDRQVAAVGAGQFNGIVNSVKLFYLPSALSNANADQAAQDLHDSGTSSLLSGLVLWIEPDATDAAAPGVRNRAADSDASLAFTTAGGLMTRKNEAKIQQLRGVTNTSFYTRGQTGGGSTHFRTASDPAFEPDNCIWESKVVPQTINATGKTIVGDDNNALDVITSGTDVVRFRADIAGTPETAVSSTIVSNEQLYAAGIIGDLDGTRKIYAAANGVIGTGVATGTLAESGEFAIGEQGTSGAAGRAPYKGYIHGVRILRFASDGDMPTLKEVKQILAYHSDAWPAIHPLVQAKLTAGTCEMVEYNGDGLVEQTAGNWAWDSYSVGTATPSHDMTERVGTDDPAMMVGDIRIARAALFVGDPAGSSGSAETLGIESNPYQGSSAISTAMGDLLMEGSELVLGGYDYKTTGNQNATFAISGRGDRKTQLTGHKDALINYATFAAVTNARIFGNQMHIARTGNNNMGGGGVMLYVIGVVSRDSTGDKGGEFTGANCFFANNLFIDNNSGGLRAVGVDAICLNNIATGNGVSDVFGVASGISDYNDWDTNSGMPTGTNDIDTTPTFKDAASKDFRPAKGSVVIDAGTRLSAYFTHNEIGPFKYGAGAARRYMLITGYL